MRSLHDGLICVIGKPDFATIQKAAAKSGEKAEVLANPENCTHVSTALTSWHKTPAIIHQLSKTLTLADNNDATIKFARKSDIIQIRDENPELADEVLQALSYSPIAAAFDNDKPVSFCYAGSETETLWDISIDTLPDFRRRGLAAACVKFMIQHMQKRGKQPVWGAEEWNVASLHLAKKLGFEAVDTLFLFRS